MDPHITPKARLLNLLLEEATGTTLHATIQTMRAEGRSFRDIAQKVTESTEVRITHESIHSWAREWGIEAGAAA